MRECLSIHIGQAGVQTGNVSEIYQLHHNILEQNSQIIHAAVTATYHTASTPTHHIRKLHFRLILGLLGALLSRTRNPA